MGGGTAELEEGLPLITEEVKTSRLEPVGRSRLRFAVAAALVITGIVCVTVVAGKFKSTCLARD